jgi:hypothetical protein
VNALVECVPKVLNSASLIRLLVSDHSAGGYISVRTAALLCRLIAGCNPDRVISLQAAAVMNCYFGEGEDGMAALSASICGCQWTPHSPTTAPVASGNP